MTDFYFLRDDFGIDCRNYYPGRAYIQLDNKNLTSFSWKGCPSSAQEVFLDDNLLKEFNWKDCPDSIKYINLCNNQLTEFNWKDCSDSIRDVQLRGNSIKEFSWKGCPKSVKKVDLDINPLEDFNWKGCPISIQHVDFPYDFKPDMTLEEYKEWFRRDEASSVIQKYVLQWLYHPRVGPMKRKLDEELSLMVGIDLTESCHLTHK